MLSCGLVLISEALGRSVPGAGKLDLLLTFPLSSKLLLIRISEQFGLALLGLESEKAIQGLLT